MKAGIRSYLLADSDITDEVGQKIYSFPAPQGTEMPYIMISLVTETIQNLITDDLDIYDGPWQVDVLAAYDKDATRIAELVVGRLKNAARVAMGNYWVYDIVLNSVGDTSDLEDNADQKKIARKTIEFELIRDREVEP